MCFADKPSKDRLGHIPLKICTREVYLLVIYLTSLEVNSSAGEDPATQHQALCTCRGALLQRVVERTAHLLAPPTFPRLKERHLAPSSPCLYFLKAVIKIPASPPSQGCSN